MFRKIVAMGMLISFIAMSSSGAMMFVIGKPSFTIQMHAVHKIFGIVMILSAIAHIALNFKAIKAHLHHRTALFVAGIFTASLILLYGVALNSGVSPELATTMDEAASKAESGDKSK